MNSSAIVSSIVRKRVRRYSIIVDNMLVYYDVDDNMFRLEINGVGEVNLDVQLRSIDGDDVSACIVGDWLVFYSKRAMHKTRLTQSRKPPLSDELKEVLRGLILAYQTGARNQEVAAQLTKVERDYTMVQRATKMYHRATSGNVMWRIKRCCVCESIVHNSRCHCGGIVKYQNARFSLRKNYVKSVNNFRSPIPDNHADIAVFWKRDGRHLVPEYDYRDALIEAVQGFVSGDEPDGSGLYMVAKVKGKETIYPLVLIFATEEVRRCSHIKRLGSSHPDEDQIADLRKLATQQLK